MANPVPKAYAVSPATVPAAGGKLIQMVAANVVGATPTVTVGGTAATAIVMNSTMLGQFAVPAKTAGAYDLVVTTTDGTSTLVGAVRYV